MQILRVKFLSNWPLQNSTGPRNIGPQVNRYERGDLPPPPPETGKRSSNMNTIETLGELIFPGRISSSSSISGIRK